MKILLLVLSIIAFLHTAACADEFRSLKDWVPKGWRTIKEVTGDLNGDGIKDVVVIFEEDNPKNKKDNTGLGSDILNTNLRTIVVLLGERDQYKKIAENMTFVPPESDEESPCLADPLSDVRIQKGILRVTLTEWLSCGSWSVTSYTYTFRYDGIGMQLIGKDESSYMRNSGEKSEISTNYLTSKRKTTTGLNEFNKSKPKTTWEVLKNEPPKYLEQL